MKILHLQAGDGFVDTKEKLRKVALVVEQALDASENAVEAGDQGGSDTLPTDI